MPSTFLDDRGVARVTGADARSFLQGLFTCDLTKVAPGRPAYGALLTPQGKIIVDFIVREGDEGFDLDCPAALAADLVKRLRFYKLRAKVEVADESARLGVRVHWGDAPGAGEPDPRDPALGRREIVARAGHAPDPDGLAAWTALRIARGVPEGGVDFAYGDAFPHEANMDLLDGVDFRKGCYVGQEVVSRVEHRGSARKRVARLEFDGAAPPRGAPVLAGEVEIGVVGSATEGAALAMTRLDRAREAIEAGLALRVDGRVARLAEPERRG